MSKNTFLLFFSEKTVKDFSIHIPFNGLESANNASLPPKQKSDTIQSSLKKNDIVSVESDRNNIVPDDTIEIRPLGGMCFVAGLGDPIPYKTAQNTINLSKISDWGKQQNNNYSIREKIEYTITLTIWIIEVAEFLEVSRFCTAL